MSWPAAVTLQGERAIVAPLSMEHHDALVDVVRDGELWKLWYTRVPSPETMRADIERRLGLRERGSMLPFVIIDNAHNKIVGATSYMNIDADNKRVEIGSTWYAQSAQRTGVNTECKYLMLRHAFETLDCIAVEFRTHHINRQSRTAIERLGAKLDGILRSHWRLADGALRDTCVYSIIAAEWPTVRAHLKWQMTKPRS
ncbi:MAG: GNAT family N-acetyltransferase [Rudaea sp.]|uniref:GNAT family N-acetyltransferase n=1 Tax=unclassified Rudaea TaxID=2627037 RepID=UPI0010F987D1|nr:MULTISPECIES: GNAT family protein [unclassified Rudaea]MBN8885807.1 GNAT family N-acetyltransferase [Rudaea sp.]MBR0347924.1 GNAT family N-acetyltransferase [Rudaea sp.]